MTTQTGSHLIGKVVRDVSAEVWPDDWVPHYVVGKTGFMSLSDGQFLPYDSAFPGPAFFDCPAFVVVDLPPVPRTKQ